MKVHVKLLIQELTYHEFEIRADDETLYANCYLSVEESTVILRQVDIEGPGASSFGSRFLRIVHEVAKQIGLQFGCKRVEIHGAKRSTGKLKGKTPRPIVVTISD